MVVHVEESVATVAAPARRLDGGSKRHVCVATLAGQRYVFYALGAVVVVLRETHAGAIASNPRREAKRVSAFDLWQVWHGGHASTAALQEQDGSVQCLAFNDTTQPVARGALALCAHDGRVIILTPSATAPPPIKPVNTPPAKMRKPASTANSVSHAHPRPRGAVTSAYAKMHLHLQLPTWQERVRWRSEDRSMDRVAWVDAGDELWLVGVGRKVTIWKLVEDAAGLQAYLHQSFSVVGGGGGGDEPLKMPLRGPPVSHMDVTETGRFIATAGRHDRIIKMWTLGERARDGAPVCSFLAHPRALVEMQWGKSAHAYKIKRCNPRGHHAEMLYTLDRAGTVCIWRENTVSAVHAFTRWKVFTPDELLVRGPLARVVSKMGTAEEGGPVGAESRLVAFGMMQKDWGRPMPQTTTPMVDALLDERNVLSAISLYHYGRENLDEVRRQEFFTQRMDGNTLANSAKLLGGRRSGAVADTHAGEGMISGNLTLNKTFTVNVAYGIHANGDLSLFRVESVPFSVRFRNLDACYGPRGVASRVSLLCTYDGLRGQLADAVVYCICSADFTDREASRSSFLAEIFYQPQRPESHLKSARLKFQAESGVSRVSRSASSYTVQVCEVGDLAGAVLSAHRPIINKERVNRSLAVTKVNPRLPTEVDLQNQYTRGIPQTIVATNDPRGDFDILRMCGTSSYCKLRSARHQFPSVTSSENSLFAASQVPSVFSVCYVAQGIMFYFLNGRMHATAIPNDDEGHRLLPTSAERRGSGSSPGASEGVDKPSTDAANKNVLFREDEVDSDGITELIMVGVSASQKREWSLAPTSFCFSDSSETPSINKDFCMLVGLRPGGRSLVVWVFSFTLTCDSIETDGEGAGTTLVPKQLELLRREEVGIPNHSMLTSIAATPSLDDYHTMFISVDKVNHLSIWAFKNMDDLNVVESVHSVDVGGLLRTRESNLRSSHQFDLYQCTHVLQQLRTSTCGRVAMLFQSQATQDSSVVLSDAVPPTQHLQTSGDVWICIKTLFDGSCEAIVKLPRDKIGTITSVQWTPPLTSTGICQLVCLSSTGVISVLQHLSAMAPHESNNLYRHSPLHTLDKWQVAWVSNRFSVAPRVISSLASYPSMFLELGMGIACVNMNNIAGESSSVASSIAKSASAISEELGHPIVLLFLLMRGSFRSLDTVLRHIQTSFLEHEKTCYLRMADDSTFRSLPLLSFSQLFGHAKDDQNGDSPCGESEHEERPPTYLLATNGGHATAFQKSATSAPPPARASDLFAMDFGVSRRTGNSQDRAAALFAPVSSQSTSNDTPKPVSLKSSLAIETNELSKFFRDHKDSLMFMPEEYRDVLLAIVEGARRTIAWESDSSRAKDEAALRFVSSLKWPHFNREQTDKVVNNTSGTDTAASKSESVATTDPTCGICSEQIAWAAVSEHQSEILRECFPSTGAAPLTLTKLLEWRLPFWVKSASRLAQFAEKAVQTEYAAQRDPFRVALVYILLGKTTLLAKLFVMANERKIADLLVNNFSDPRWRNAAVKNAYVLKTKCRYALSAAFFLLGGKVQEAMTVVEHEDPTLVTSFLIARLSEQWDLGGGSTGDGAGSSHFGDVSLTGLSSNLRHLTSGNGDASEGGGVTTCKGVSREYLKSAVWAKAQSSGDLYMAFLVKYYVGETPAAFQALLTVPGGEVTCMFAACRVPGEKADHAAAGRNTFHALYWQVFGQNLLGAVELVRILAPSIRPMTSALRMQIVNLQTASLQRLATSGWTVTALYQQRDFAEQFKKIRQTNGPSSSPSVASCYAALLSVREHILCNSIRDQARVIADDAARHVLSSSSPSSPGASQAMLQLQSDATSIANPMACALEARINSEIACLVRRGGMYALGSVTETSCDSTERRLRAATSVALEHAGHDILVEFLSSSWSSRTGHDTSKSDGSDSKRAMLPTASTLPAYIDKVITGVTALSSGDLASKATSQSFSKRADQICSELLATVDVLLLWLSYTFHRCPASTAASAKAPSSTRVRSGSTSAFSNPEYIRVVSAAIYSVVCICCRYVKSPCCLHRTLTAIFPHMNPLSKKTILELHDIAQTDVCTNCIRIKQMSTASTSSATTPSSTSASSSSSSSLPSFQQDLRVLHAVVGMLHQDMNAVADEIRTHRLEEERPSPSASFTFCQYWTMVLVIGTSGMPEHIARVAIDGANAASNATMLAKRLARAWTTYSTTLAQSTSRYVLCELATSYLRPFDLRATTATSAVSFEASSVSSGTVARPSSPSKLNTSGNGFTNGSPTPVSPTSPLSPTSASKRKHMRELLRCKCERCPWQLILKMFVAKDEFLLRVNAQLECCTASIQEEINWGHLPAFPSGTAVLTRSQRRLLADVAQRDGELTDLLEKRLQQSHTPAIVMPAHCIYRSEVSIKSFCFNRATEPAEMVLCGSKGVCRTSSIEYSDGTKYQFKGMFANPQTVFFGDSGVGTGLDASGHVRRRSMDSATIHRTMTAAANAQRGTASSSSSPSGDGKAPHFKPTAVESHPFLPLFVSGSHKGKVHLWSYDSLSAVNEFQTNESASVRCEVSVIVRSVQIIGANPQSCVLWILSGAPAKQSHPLSPTTSSRRSIKNIHFDNLGQQMGAVNTSGQLFLWKFANLDHAPCYRELECHDKGAKALQFLNSGSVVATAGTSSDKRSVCMWDLLLPSSQALIAAPTCHPAGAASLAFSSTHQLLLSGGESGSLSVFDVRQRRMLHTISHAHETAITTLRLHPSGRCVLSGSASGDIKIWSLPIFREVVAVNKVHTKPSFLGDAATNLLGDAASNIAINVTNSSWGVTDAVATDNYFFTSGTDGSVQRFTVPSLEKLF